jgi:hypothetical protein
MGVVKPQWCSRSNNGCRLAGGGWRLSAVGCRLPAAGCRIVALPRRQNLLCQNQDNHDADLDRNGEVDKNDLSASWSTPDRARKDDFSVFVGELSRIVARSRLESALYSQK